MSTILITTSSFDTDTPEIKALENAGYTIKTNPYKRRLSETEVGELLTADVIGLIAGVEPLTANVINNAPHLRVISRCGIGMDSVDLDAAAANGITVVNTPDAPTKAVAELAIGLMLDVLRGISSQDRAMRGGAWQRPMGGLLGAKTLGLIGYGRIGRAVAQMVQGFGTKTIAYDPHIQGTNDGTPLVDLDTLLSTADIISLHIPYTTDNHHLINADALAKMKDGAIIINTARGGLIDEDALTNALNNGKLSGAGIDAFENEPYTGALTKCETAVLTAHVGSYALEARQEQERQAAVNLLEALNAQIQRTGT